MTEAAAMLQDAALTNAATDAFSVDWRCKQGYLQEDWQLWPTASL